jgi:DNA-binding GntR family transcriptional regulator
VIPAELAARLPAPRSLSEQAYDRLVRDITRLEIAPGEVLGEKALVARYDIGRTPIREALQRLAIEGLVVHLPNRGMFVSDISAQSVQNIYEFRMLVDGHTARLAATRASDEDVESLEAVHQALVEATAADDVDRWVDYDRLFYDVLAGAARNIYLAEVIPRIFNLHLRLWFFIAKRIGGWRAIAVAHEEMTKGVAEAIRRRNPDEAEVAMKAYIARRHQDVRRLL